MAFYHRSTEPRQKVRHMPVKGFKHLDRPYLLLTLTALIWSGNAIAGKFAVDTVPPMALTFLRWSLAAIVLMIIAARPLKRDAKLIRQNIGRLAAMGAIGFGAFNLLLYNALHTTTALNVTIEQSAMPMLIIFLGFLIHGERGSWRQVAGITLSLAGVAVTAAHGDLARLIALRVNPGDALMLLAVLAYSGYTIALRGKPAIHGLSFLCILSLSAAATSLPFFIYEMWQGDIFTPSLKGAGLILYVALLPSILAQLFYARGVELIGAARAGQFINLVPLFAAFLAVILLGEELQGFHFIGFGLIMGGIWLGARKTI